MAYEDTLDFHQIGCRVRELRKRKGLTQEELAETANLSVPFVSHIERGTKKGSLSSFIRLAAALEVTVDALLPGPRADETADFCPDVQSIFGNCSRQERQTLLKITAAVKQILRDAA